MTNLPSETNKYGCLPCPFCNGFEAVQVQQVQVTPGAKPDFAVVCPHCDARGPWALEFGHFEKAMPGKFHDFSPF